MQFSVSTTSKELEITLALSLVLALALVPAQGKLDKFFRLLMSEFLHIGKKL